MSFHNSNVYSNSDNFKRVDGWTLLVSTTSTVPTFLFITSSLEFKTTQMSLWNFELGIRLVEAIPAMTRTCNQDHDHSHQIMKSLVKMVMTLVTCYGHCRHDFY